MLAEELYSVHCSISDAEASDCNPTSGFFSIKQIGKNRHSAYPKGRMAKTCVFCGQRPESKSKEHVIPRWLIELTGDPKRQVSFGTYNITGKRPTVLAFDQLTFPACERCNGDFSALEDRAKPVIEGLLAREPLKDVDFNCLLDWLDKVRTGIWLGLTWLEGNPWGIEPKFHISSRLRLHDRSVAIGFIKGRNPGINLVGPESPAFGLAPTTMCLFINELALFNSSTIGLCSRRLGFPFAARYTTLSNGLMEVWLAPGLERVMKPVERTGMLQGQPSIYQPVFEIGIDGSLREEFNTAYVRDNSFDFGARLGALFLQHRGEVLKLLNRRSDAWVPNTTLSLVDAYQSGRSWAYKKLEQHYSEQAPSGDRTTFSAIHKRIHTLFEKHMGL